jgi:hypothetical protein
MFAHFLNHQVTLWPLLNELVVDLSTFFCDLVKLDEEHQKVKDKYDPF